LTEFLHFWELRGVKAVHKYVGEIEPRILIGCNVMSEEAEEANTDTFKNIWQKWVSYSTQSAKDCVPYNRACKYWCTCQYGHEHVYVSHNNPWQMHLARRFLRSSSHILTLKSYFFLNFHMWRFEFTNETCKNYHFNFWLWRPQSLTHTVDDQVQARSIFRWQCHHHFRSSFFALKYFTKLFCAYSLGL